MEIVGILVIFVVPCEEGVPLLKGDLHRDFRYHGIVPDIGKALVRNYRRNILPSVLFIPAFVPVFISVSLLRIIRPGAFYELRLT